MGRKIQIQMGLKNLLTDEQYSEPGTLVYTGAMPVGLVLGCPPPRLRSDSTGRNHSVIVPFPRLLFANVRERPRQAPGCRSVAAVHRSPSLHNPLTLPPFIPHPVYGICIQVASFAETKRPVRVILVRAHRISRLIFPLIHAKLRF